VSRSKVKALSAGNDAGTRPVISCAGTGFAIGGGAIETLGTGADGATDGGNDTLETLGTGTDGATDGGNDAAVIGIGAIDGGNGDAIEALGIGAGGVSGMKGVLGAPNACAATAPFVVGFSSSALGLSASKRLSTGRVSNSF